MAETWQHCRVRLDISTGVVLCSYTTSFCRTVDEGLLLRTPVRTITSWLRLPHQRRRPSPFLRPQKPRRTRRITEEGDRGSEVTCSGLWVLPKLMLLSVYLKRLGVLFIYVPSSRRESQSGARFHPNVTSPRPEAMPDHASIRPAVKEQVTGA